MFDRNFMYSNFVVFAQIQRDLHNFSFSFYFKLKIEKNKIQFNAKFIFFHLNFFFLLSEI